MPNRFRPINAGTSYDMAMSQINQNFQQLDAESVTKAYKGLAGNSIVEGRLPNNRYGQLYYDDSGKARILIGQAPDDGRMGIWVSADGQDVIDQLGG